MPAFENVIAALDKDESLSMAATMARLQEDLVETLVCYSQCTDLVRAMQDDVVRETSMKLSLEGEAIWKSHRIKESSRF
jgi:energy-coupling factor transporter ATP-binding protein EcfA2